MSAGDDRALPFAAPKPIGPFVVFLRPPPEGWTGTPRLTVCVNRRPENGIAVSCAARGSEAIAAALQAAVTARGLALEIDTFRCLGMCEKGPTVRLTPGNNWFFGVKPENLDELLDAALKHFRLSQAAP